ncbi:MAG TPA: Gfo/Idh/MocA family oxidoreductase [Phototrophicaceae bacterium]|nr:Gfo/Idh/MocA family oxidoreductase [Phototrophicaceae bacterium]
MTDSREQRTKAFSLNPEFNYLPDEDRYLLSNGTPRYAFNVIGSGVNGQEHIRVTHLEGRATIHGVYDPNPRSIERAQITHAQYAPKAPPLVVYDSLAAACTDPAVDGIIISTPNYTHLDVLRVAAQSGKHILMEKPIATTIADADAITRIAESYPAIFQLGLQYRYKAMYAEAIYEALTRRTLGDIKLIGIQEHRIPFLDKVGQWNKFAKYSGDTLVEKCCHYFDLLNLFAQSRPQTVYASGSMAVNFKDFEYKGEKSDILDSAMVIVNYANGVRANFNLCMFAPMIYEELVICGDEGRLKAWERQDFLAGQDMASELEILCGERKPSRKMRPGYPALIEASGHHGATYYEQIQFIDRIEGKQTNAATPLDGLWSVIVAVCAQESIKRGQVVAVDEILASEKITL